MRTYTAADFGYKDDAMLMNPMTGSVASAKEWAEEAHTWFCDNTTDKHLHTCICEQFSTLCEIE